MTSTQQSLIGLASLLALAATQACSSDSTGSDMNAAGTGAARAGAGGAPASQGGAPSGGAPTAGAPSAGAPSAGAPTAGAPSAGAPSTGGASNGSGGASTGGGGSGKGGAGGGNAGGPATGAATFAQVAGILSTACAGAMCHGGNNHINLTMMNGLYGRLTMPLPAAGPHCGGTALIVPSNVTGSFLAQVVQGPSTCMKNGTPEQLPRMPAMCSPTSTNPRACLTAAQIKTITDWIGAGAPQ